MLHLPPAPAAAVRSVVTALHSPTAAHSERAPAAVRTAGGEVRPEHPLPIHELTGIGDPAGTRARLSGWRFLLHAPAGSGRDGAPSPAVGAAEAVLTADGWAFAHWCEGPYVHSAERGVREAEALPGDFQPRLLSLPQLYMLTLWLHRDPGADPALGAPGPADLLIPLAPAPPGIAADAPRRVDALLPLLARRTSAPPLLGAPA
jgi:hypothetical protein